MRPTKEATPSSDSGRRRQQAAPSTTPLPAELSVLDMCAVWWVQDPLWRSEAFEVADVPAYDFFLLLSACPRQTAPQAQQAIVGVSTGTGVGGR
jgi:hypothetical protein